MRISLDLQAPVDPEFKAWTRLSCMPERVPDWFQQEYRSLTFSSQRWALQHDEVKSSMH